MTQPPPSYAHGTSTTPLLGETLGENLSALPGDTRLTGPPSGESDEAHDPCSARGFGEPPEGDGITHWLETSKRGAISQISADGAKWTAGVVGP